jgi:hypothetical protein
MMDKLDGNAAGGILQEIFPFEMTLVQTTCTGCGVTNAIGELAVYLIDFGIARHFKPGQAKDTVALGSLV